MNNSEEERNINLTQKLTQAWQEMVEAGQLSVYMAMSDEEIKKLQETDDEEIGKNEHIVAYLRAVRQMCQKAS